MESTIQESIFVQKKRNGEKNKKQSNLNSLKLCMEGKKWFATFLGIAGSAICAHTLGFLPSVGIIFLIMGFCLVIS